MCTWAGYRIRPSLNTTYPRPNNNLFFNSWVNLKYLEKCFWWAAAILILIFIQVFTCCISSLFLGPQRHYILSKTEQCQKVRTCRPGILHLIFAQRQTAFETDTLFRVEHWWLLWFFFNQNRTKTRRRLPVHYIGPRVSMVTGKKEMRLAEGTVLGNLGGCSLGCSGTGDLIMHKLHPDCPQLLLILF